MSDVELRVAPCEHEAARYAVMNWHYSRSMPRGKLVKLGVWEHDVFIGAVIFARGASPALGRRFGLDQTQCCELVRVALREHESPVTKIVAEALRLLREMNPALRAVVSFADPDQDHFGIIYQAGNWIYLGQSSSAEEVLVEGRWQHNRNLRPTGWGTLPRAARVLNPDELPRRTRQGKYRYVMPFDKQIRRAVLKLVKDKPPRPVTDEATSSA